MKVVVFSYPEAIPKEIETVQALFDVGLDRFHLRKPMSTELETKAFLTQISEEHYPKIVLHQHFQLAKRYSITHLHYSETARKQTLSTQLEEWNKNGYRLSTSVHDLETYHALSPIFEKAFLGPVFPSISKQGYQASEDWLPKLQSFAKNAVQLWAIGGITPENLKQLFATQVDGAALLGSIWTDIEQAVNHFKQCC